jgi:hypothetical protein
VALSSLTIDQIQRNHTLGRKGELSMKKIGFLLGLVLMFTALTSLAAEQTWTGMISDSMCGVSHKAMEHGGKKTDAHDCTVACVKGGAKYVFVSKGKVFDVENQDLVGLEEMRAPSN